MAVDLRRIVACNLGPIVSGDLGCNHISDRSGLVMWSGRLQFDGIVNPARGALVELLVASPQRGTVTRFPIPLRVIRAVTFVKERRSEVEVGCKLTLMKERKDQAQYFANYYTPSWYTETLNAGFSEEAINKIAPRPIYSHQVLLRCLSELGLTLAGSSEQLSFSVLRSSIDLSQGYVQVIGDLIRSECCYGRILPDESFQVVKMDLAKGGKGPILRDYNLISIDPITTGAEPADYYIVRYSATQIKYNPEDSASPGGGGGGGGGGDPVDPNDPISPGSDWTESETISPPNKIEISYAPVVNNAKVERRVTLTSTTRASSRSEYESILYEDAGGKQQQRDVLLKKTDTTWTTIASVNQAYVAWCLENGRGLPSGGAKSENITYYKYYIGTDGPVLFEETTEQYISEAQFAGGLQLYSYAGYQPSGEKQILSERTIRTTLAFKTAQGRDYTQVKTSRWMARGVNAEGKQDIAGFIGKAKELIDVDPTIVARVAAGAVALVFEGTEVQNETGRLALPSKPTDQELAADRVQNEKSPPEAITSPSPQVIDSANKNKPATEYTTTSERTLVARAIFDEQQYTNLTATSIANYSMPYSPDDMYLVNAQGKVSAFRQGSNGAAYRFGALENALDIGHAYGCNIVTGFDEMPSLPMAPVYVRQAGIEAAFLTDSISYAFDGDGMVVSADLMLLGVTGYYGANPPAVSWVRLPVPPAGLNQLDDGTTEANYAKANTISIPAGFDPTAPGPTFAALPANGVDVFSSWRDQPHIVGPTLEVVTSETAISVTGDTVEYPYELFLEPVISETGISVTGDSVVSPAFYSVEIPTAVVEVVALAPATEINVIASIPTAMVNIDALVPVIEVPALIDVPSATVSVYAMAPAVDVPVVIDVPVAVVDVVALSLGTDEYPITISPAAWWKPSTTSSVTVIDGKVSAISDLSGNGFDLIQATSADRPTYVSSALNGKAAMRWPSTANQVHLYRNGSNTLTVAEVYIVAKFAATEFANFEGLFGPGGGGSAWIIGGFSSQSLYTSGPWSEAYVNNSSTNTFTSILPALASPCIIRLPLSSGTVSTTSIRLGMDRDYLSLNRGWRGDIYEVIVFGRILNSTERAGLISYLSTAYAITVS